MFWVIRWTDAQSQEDRAMVVEAASRAAAECTAAKRNIPLVFVGEATDADVAAARKAKRLWKYTPDTRHTCFGTPVRTRELACLMLLGVWLTLVLLRNSGVHVLPAVWG
ncbi:MAG TPA: hypothetical protein VK324_06250 [Tepidisphaeraceae bacterium]|nr:hypothetical protein [Tepidisphaeraceae bacterium]